MDGQQTHSRQTVPAGPRRGKAQRGRWYEKYLPFVVRSVDKQVEWLQNALRRKNLTNEEVAPYIRLLLADRDDEELAVVGERLQAMAPELRTAMLDAADFFDLPLLITLLPNLTSEQAAVALRKGPPAYEEKKEILLDRVYQAIHDISATLLNEAAAIVRQDAVVPSHFEAEYARFQEILADQEILSSLYPKARG